MPSYKTHSIHGEILLPQIDKKVDIDKEDLKAYCLGPDAMMLTDNSSFNNQHSSKTKEYFEQLLKIIKEKKLSDNKEVMAFLYGQIDHFVLDSTTHPLIYYMTEKKPSNIVKYHSLLEMWIDEYISKKYNKKESIYYHKFFMKDKKLVSLCDELYNKVYSRRNGGIKYSIGMFYTIAFEVIRKNSQLLIPYMTKRVGNRETVSCLNLKHKTWYNPETGEERKASFDDLWKKSFDISLETIEDVNNYLYNDKPLNNSLINNNTSYNTGLSCEAGQNFKYVKRYRD